MKIINTDIQARAVLQLVAATALFFAGVLILVYRLLEPTQQLLYHSISSSFQVMMVCFGVSILLRSYFHRAVMALRLSSLSAVVCLVAIADGVTGSSFDAFDTQIPWFAYLAFAPLALSLLPAFSASEERKPWQKLFLQAVAGYALLLAVIGFAFFIMHLFLKAPLLAKHPTGSLIVCVAALLVGLACYVSHNRGRRPLPKLSPTSANFTTLSVLTVIVFGVGMFHTQMSDLRDAGQRAVQQLQQTRIAMGENTLELFNRLARRWEVYPLDVHSALMEVDIATYLEDVDYLDALFLVAPDGRVVFERLKPSRVSYFEAVMNDKAILEGLASDTMETEILIPEFAARDLTAKMVVRVPVDFADPAEQEDSGIYSVLALLDVRALLGVAMLSNVETDIETYTLVRPGRWMDRSGFWVTEPTETYLENKAIKLYSSELSMYYSSGIPTTAYLYRLDTLQETSNLQMLIIVGGIGLVLLVVLAVERNVSLEVQGRQLFYQAHHDALTGLWNRASIEQYIGSKFYESRDVTVLFIDLDGFTLINDSLGLHVGDAILNQLAERLESEQPRRSELARFASDEFILVLDGATTFPERVRNLAHDIMNIVAQPYHVGDNKVYLTATIGVAHQSPDVATPLELIQRADMAMHQAKKLGYNYVLEYEPNMAKRLLTTSAMRSRLQEAIDNDALELHYQPIVRCTDQQVVQVEALLRWPQTDGSFIAPDEFIPVAEMTGQIIPLSEWVFKRACEDALELQKQESKLRMSVNISALHFNRANFVDFVLNTLAETGCRGTWLELELTESILLEGSEYAIERLQTLRKHGLSIALDDFGTGFSSLSYLKRLPLDVVKIDRSFIAGIRHHKGDRVLIESVIKIAQSLDFAVLAEGIETPQQAEFVTELGCNYLQGYYFGRPVPLKNL